MASTCFPFHSICFLLYDAKTKKTAIHRIHADFINVIIVTKWRPP